ncbi:sigma-70 family RNA polymerase sigma factor [Cutibacterium equinum]|uniref:Sigma-70 family RNA polymerase sigma factor n=1 Tax=Cutibacterium equinum TaxID=3016342 RepID=A0ABY7R198_9ACTN|nr:sigma-70 family RNA polymerase sigma factor [Cutibacterium equinum]WCC80705.1 sigma-70 family RNA polymerase sigma factor [Cutibacterium equinum]
MRYTDFIDGVVALDPADERELFRRLDAGVTADAILSGRFLASTPVTVAELTAISDDGAAARQMLWRQMLAMVLTQARQAASTHGCSFEDLVQVGCVGLGEAIERYDERRGARFSTVAWTWIRRRIGEEIVRLRGARSRAAMRESAEVARVEEELTMRTQQVPSSEAIAARMGKDIMWVEQRRGECWQIDSAVVEYVADPHDQPVSRELHLLAALPGQERRVVALRHGFEGDPMTFEAVGEELGISASSVRRIEQRALDRLRHRMRRAGTV